MTSMETWTRTEKLKNWTDGLDGKREESAPREAMTLSRRLISVARSFSLVSSWGALPSCSQNLSTTAHTKSATDGHRLLCEAYGKHALSIKSCEYWFRRFKSGDFDTRDKERGGRLIKFEDAELEALLDEDSSQTQEELAETLGVTQQAISNRLKVMGMVQKQGNWVPYELKPGNIERHICTCELLLKRQNRKGFLHRIVTGDEKWIHYDNPKRRKSSVKPGHASTSTAKPNIHGKKLMLCIWWDQLGVIYYERLQPNETITGERYQQQLMRLSRALKIKRPLYAKRHDKVIYQHDNARPHVAKVVKETLEALQWDVLPHPLYSPDIAPSDYHMFRSMTHGLAEQHFTSYEEAKNWVNVWIASKDEEFFRHGIRMLPERWEKVIDGTPNSLNVGVVLEVEEGEGKQAPGTAAVELGPQLVAEVIQPDKQGSSWVSETGWRGPSLSPAQPHVSTAAASEWGRLHLGRVHDSEGLHPGQHQVLADLSTQTIHPYHEDFGITESATHIHYDRFKPNSRGARWNLGSDSTSDFEPSQGHGYGAKKVNWVPYELKPGNIERRICTCKLLLKRQNRKGFLHRFVAGDEKWIHYDNPKRRKSSVKPGHASTSTAKPNIHGKKLMLCIWWDQLGVIYYELLQPNETITGERYQQQMMRLSRVLKIKRPLYAKRHDKVIYQHDNARPHVAKVVKETLEALQWDVQPHPLYSPDIAPSDYHMFRSMTHGLDEETKNWVNVWIASKDEEYFQHGIRMLPERGEKVIEKYKVTGDLDKNGETEELD
ncbi:SETMAR [Cordylochernes scorpioides]|uniref:SETMAR n=1 Tax=Cordylochernes scorpioides TaxID=51811 RepID=A0ABY6K6P6_9ARAC|nr:SETMAR [Cordylochernes scorpioides]